MADEITGSDQISLLDPEVQAILQGGGQDVKGRQTAIAQELPAAQAEAADLRARRAEEAERQRQTSIANQREIAGDEQRIAADTQRALETYPTSANLTPPTYKPVTMQDLQSNIFPLLIMATIGGLGSRRHAMGALKSFGAMLQGAEQGRQDAYEAAASQYQKSFQQLQQAQQEHQRRFNTILNSDRMSLNEKINAMKLADLENGSYDARTYEEPLKALDARINKLTAEADTLAKAERANDVRLKLGQLAQKRADEQNQVHLKDEDIKWIAPSVLANNFRTSGIVTGFKGKADQEAMIHAAQQLAQDLGIQPSDVPALSAQMKANVASLAFQTRALDNLKKINTSFHNNLQTWDELAAGVPLTIHGAIGERLNHMDAWRSIDFTQSQSVNNFLNNAKKEFNNPQVVAYLTATTAVISDYARIIAGGAGGSIAMTAEGARNDAARLISAGANPEARHAQMAALESDTQGQINGAENQVANIRARIKSLTAPKTDTGHAPADATIDQLLNKYGPNAQPSRP